MFQGCKAGREINQIACHRKVYIELIYIFLTELLPVGNFVLFSLPLRYSLTNSTGRRFAVLNNFVTPRFFFSLRLIKSLVKQKRNVVPESFDDDTPSDGRRVDGRTDTRKWRHHNSMRFESYGVFACGAPRAELRHLLVRSNY